MDAPRPTKDFARALRKRMTPPEIGLWLGLRGGQVGGLRFRRQHPIGRYVLDFYCVEIGLAVEVDGDGHSFGSARARRAPGRLVAHAGRGGVAVVGGVRLAGYDGRLADDRGAGARVARPECSP
jgi:hypothetical protein